MWYNNLFDDNDAAVITTYPEVNFRYFRAFMIMRK